MAVVRENLVFIAKGTTSQNQTANQPTKSYAQATPQAQDTT
jgi:hypothetical protein